jgi:hypothetical protein
VSDSQKKGKYDDIIDLPHHVSYRHARMSRIDRAAQFSPFAALTGYEAAVQETARLTEGQKELDETALAVLNEKLRLLADLIEDKPQVSITYFRPDERKQGGAYLTVEGAVKAVNEYAHTVTMADGTVIPMRHIREISGELFEGWTTE